MTPDRDLIAIAAALGAALRERGLMVTTAESCTGGLIACALTETAGSSAWFDRGFVTYSNEAKVDLLGVDPDVLQAHGAVSEVVAAGMAGGALARSRAALALSVTGIAGPGGAVPGKPVGTVCFGWAIDDGRGRVRRHQETRRFDGERAQVRLGAARHALEQALALLSISQKD